MRSGAAVVELAVCLPVLLLILLGTIESCNMLYVAQSMKISAFEAARVGVVPEADAANVLHQCETLLTDQGVQGATVTLTPADPSTLNEGDIFTVHISADYAANALFGGSLFGNHVIDRSVSLRTE